MTAKEQLLREAPAWSEHDAQVALWAVEREHAGHVVDVWGDLDAFGDVLTGDALRRLDEDERAELGETIADAWRRERTG
jgi:hypothetical protein